MKIVFVFVSTVRAPGYEMSFRKWQRKTFGFFFEPRVLRFLLHGKPQSGFHESFEGVRGNFFKSFPEKIFK